MSLNDCNNEKKVCSGEMEKLKRQMEQQTEMKNVQEREMLLLRAKLDTQLSTIEELEKIRRQHIALHEDVNRIKLESYDYLANNKELIRINQNMKEEISHLKEQLEEERRHLEEINISNEKIVSKITRRFEDEQTEIREKMKHLERENSKLKISMSKSNDVYKIRASDYARLKAKQYGKIADRLNSLLDHLKISELNSNESTKPDIE